MARARPNLEKAINEILLRHGTEGKRLSFRQAERRTGLSPATISELAKGNARTPETIRRFAQGLGEDAGRLLLLAGFTPDEVVKPESGRARGGMAARSTGERGQMVARSASAGKLTPLSDEAVVSDMADRAISENGSSDGLENGLESDLANGLEDGLEPQEGVLLERLASVLCRLPPGPSRTFMQEHLRHTAELLERFVELER